MTFQTPCISKTLTRVSELLLDVVSARVDIAVSFRSVVRWEHLRCHCGVHGAAVMSFCDLKARQVMFVIQLKPPVTDNNAEGRGVFYG